ncbi:hypothetical protein SLS62_007478 [Diatrype stigma]|uniref:Uncharacterized protein n=1 Tax=Diatrype stigma TaxID=117547 RepID=A0AAN9UP88_9PEZI
MPISTLLKEPASRMGNLLYRSMESLSALNTVDQLEKMGLYTRVDGLKATVKLAIKLLPVQYSHWQDLGYPHWIIGAPGYDEPSPQQNDLPAIQDAVLPVFQENGSHFDLDYHLNF